MVQLKECDQLEGCGPVMAAPVKRSARILYVESPVYISDNSHGSLHDANEPRPGSSSPYLELRVSNGALKCRLEGHHEGIGVLWADRYRLAVLSCWPGSVGEILRCDVIHRYVQAFPCGFPLWLSSYSVSKATKGTTRKDTTVPEAFSLY